MGRYEIKCEHKKGPEVRTAHPPVDFGAASRASRADASFQPRVALNDLPVGLFKPPPVSRLPRRHGVLAD